MIAIRPMGREEVKANWDRRRARVRVERSHQPPPPRPVNVRQVLDIGTLVYFQWRGRSFGVPPMPWKQGAQLMDVYLLAQSLGETINSQNAERYYAALQEMARIMWKCTRPVGMFRRLLKRLRILGNPYRKASEKELAELAVFFLGCRMREQPNLRRISSWDPSAPEGQTT